VKFLLDTHILLWAAGEPDKLPPAMRTCIEDEQNEMYFSTASIWEIAIKRKLGRDDFVVDPRKFHIALKENGYIELPIRSEHALFVYDLPLMHKNPFDRMLVAQSSTECMGLITVDQAVIDYGGAVLFDGDEMK
jgi:PIN domain nuclease of toxin-antitoxin system